ncbi:MAG: phytanoyl-CoA dioxygenase family protein [Candidatus Latescibacterota bacterium]|nr:phytanoyl-CoA dioxygenase family protein [Candidatus Latescibacterota bacterium]
MLFPDQVETYQRDGYLILEDVLSPAQTSALDEQVRKIAARQTDFPEASLEFEPGAASGGMDTLRKINGCCVHDPFFVDHARHPSLLGAAVDLLGPDVKLFGDQLFVKPPGGIEKTYHQDSPYFTIEPMAMVTAWVAIDEVTLDNGCMWVIPGSHKRGALDHSEAWMVGDRQDVRVPDSAMDRGAEQPITLSAGSCSLHHSLLLHRSGPNNTNTFRRGLATHFMTATSRWTGDPAEQPKYELLAGRAHEGCV